MGRYRPTTSAGYRQGQGVDDSAVTLPRGRRRRRVEAGRRVSLGTDPISLPPPELGLAGAGGGRGGLGVGDENSTVCAFAAVVPTKYQPTRASVFAILGGATGERALRVTGRKKVRRFRVVQLG
eukprot:3869771-Pyramimonas_sp.AAC.1